MASKTPWKDRKDLLKDISSFVYRKGAFFKQNSKRMSDLFEMTVYNDAVRYYKRKNYNISIHNLMRDGTFKYKLSTAGLSTNFSYFVAEKTFIDGKEKIEIHHNLKIQSSHDSHMYYTADVSVCRENGVKTVKQKNKRNHSFIENENLITFFEVKNMNPFPEILFSFSGIVLEIMPDFITSKKYIIDKNSKHLTPSIVFSGTGGAHAETVADMLSLRYGYNVIRGLYASKGKIYSMGKLNTYDA